MPTHQSHNLDDTDTIAAAVARGLRPRATAATVLALTGDLGTGKTAFTQALAKHLGIIVPVTSPTFGLMHRYSLDSAAAKGFDNLYHMDAYRIESPAELATLHWDDMISSPKNLIIVEWAEIIKQALPTDTQWINFAEIDDVTREITIG